MLCDKLIVGVKTDELIKSEKGFDVIIPFEHRLEMVQSIRYVDLAIKRESLDKIYDWKQLKYNILFSGDDWFDSDRWNNNEKILKPYGVTIIYISYTKEISSTKIKERVRGSVDFKNRDN